MQTTYAEEILATLPEEEDEEPGILSTDPVIDACLSSIYNSDFHRVLRAVGMPEQAIENYLLIMLIMVKRSGLSFEQIRECDEILMEESLSTNFCLYDLLMECRILTLRKHLGLPENPVTKNK